MSDITIDVADYACSLNIEVYFDIDFDDNGVKGSVELQRTIDVSEYFGNTCIDIPVNDIIDEIDNDKILEEARYRGLIDNNKYRELNAIEEKKRYFCKILDLNYHISIDDLLKKIKEELYGMQVSRFAV